jgi:hypothetical protein
MTKTPGFFFRCEEMPCDVAVSQRCVPAPTLEYSLFWRGHGFQTSPDVEPGAKRIVQLLGALADPG